jgi:hypothetical protein
VPLNDYDFMFEDLESIINSAVLRLRLEYDSKAVDSENIRTIIMNTDVTTLKNYDN